MSPLINDSASDAPPVWLIEASASFVASNRSTACNETDPAPLAAEARSTAPPVISRLEVCEYCVLTLAASGMPEVAEATVPDTPGFATALIVTSVAADTLRADWRGACALAAVSAPVAVTTLPPSIVTLDVAEPVIEITLIGQFCTDADKCPSTSAAI